MRGQGCTRQQLRGNVSPAALHFPTMLFHIAAAAVLTNIAFFEIYSFYGHQEATDIQFLPDEVNSPVQLLLLPFFRSDHRDSWQ